MISFGRGRAVLRLSKSLYCRESLAAGALALGPKAQVLLRQDKRFLRLEVRALGRCSSAGLKALAGELLNEALNYRYRRKVMAFHAALSAPVLAKALARGLKAMPADPLEELEPQVRADRQADVAALLEEARRMLGS